MFLGQAPFFSNFWVHFRLHFGITLGAQFATILFRGRPGVLGWVLEAGPHFDDFRRIFRGGARILVNQASGGVVRFGGPKKPKAVSLTAITKQQLLNSNY